MSQVHARININGKQNRGRAGKKELLLSADSNEYPKLHKDNSKRDSILNKSSYDYKLTQNHDLPSSQQHFDHDSLDVELIELS